MPSGEPMQYVGGTDREISTTPVIYRQRDKPKSTIDWDALRAANAERLAREAATQSTPEPTPAPPPRAAKTPPAPEPTKPPVEAPTPDPEPLIEEEIVDAEIVGGPPTETETYTAVLDATATATDELIVEARRAAIASLDLLRQIAVRKLADDREQQRRADKRPKRWPPKRKDATRPPAKPRPTVDVPAIIDEYTSGQTVPAIAKRRGHGTGTIRKVLLDAGIRLRDDRATHSGGKNRREYPAKLVADVRRLYVDEGCSQSEVADALGITVKVVYTIMRRHDIPARQGQSGGVDGAAPLKQQMTDAGVTAGDVRRWAIAQGYDVAPVGIPKAGIVEAYLLAHGSEQS